MRQGLQHTHVEGRGADATARQRQPRRAARPRDTEPVAARRSRIQRRLRVFDRGEVRGVVGMRRTRRIAHSTSPFSLHSGG